MSIEFDDPGRDSGPEELAVGSRRQRRRLPNAVWAGLAGLTVAVALVLDLTHGHEGGRPTTSPPPAGPTDSTPPTATSLLQQQLTTLALDNRRLTGHVSDPTSICPALPGRLTPTAAQRSAITRWFPQFVQLESSATTDAAEGLCAITIRSHDGLGSILIVRVVAPPNPPQSEFDVTDYGRPGLYPNFIGADYVSPKGFRAQIGLLLSAREAITAGSPTAQLAEDAGLAW
jgi:hypothetical protein